MKREDVKVAVAAIIALFISCFLWWKTGKWEYAAAMIAVVLLLDFMVLILREKRELKGKYEIKELKPYLCSECSGSGEKIGKDLYGCTC